MYKWAGWMVLICLFVFSGCMSAEVYNDEDVVAIVRGEEITVGYLRFLYPDDEMLDMVDGVVKAKLAEQEVKKMDIDISKQVSELEESYAEYSLARSFADPQADKLGMEAEEYYNKYTEMSVEMAAYINAYTSAVLGELEDDELGIEEYHHHANELLDDLAEQNEDDIEVRSQSIK